MKGDVFKALLIAVIAIPTSSLADTPYDGLYRPAGAAFESWSCDANDIGIDGGAVAILDGYLEGVENRCELTQHQQASDGSSFVAICSAEGETYWEPIAISQTSGGIAITRNGYTAKWVRCGDGPSTSISTPVPTGVWAYRDMTASIIAGGNAFSLTCKTFNAGATHPTAQISVPCPACFPNDTTTYGISIDDSFTREYQFHRISNAEGAVSDLDAYPVWHSGMIEALMAGHMLRVIENGNVVASFPLTGSRKAISRLRGDCN